RRVCPETAKQSLQAFRAISLSQRLLGDPLKLRQAVVAAILNHDLEAARRAESFEWGGLEDMDQTVRHFLLQGPLQARGDGRTGQIAFRAALERIEHDIHR